MTISFEDVYQRLIGWGYKVTKEPMEQMPPGLIELRYDMDFEPEDVAMTSYKVVHMVVIRWTEAVPDTIAGSVILLMRRLGAAYDAQPHFEIAKPRLTRGNGTMYEVSMTVLWVQWLTINQ